MLLPDITSLAFFKDLGKISDGIFLVGGPVRDLLLGRNLKDLDLLVQNIPMNELISFLENYGKTNLVGKSFGIIKFIPKQNEQLEFDIALPRKEISTGKGHKDFLVEFDHTLPIQEDLKRRDFTINAMAQNLLTEEIIDPFLGQQDLKNKIIRTTFKDSFLEDPLRLLRAIQFAARFEFNIEEETFSQMQQHAPLIKTVARERIIEEIKKLMSADKPSRGFDLMFDCGLLEFIFPDVHQMKGVTQPNKNNEDVYTHTMKVLDASRHAEELEKSGHLDIMFSALFHDAGKPATKKESAETSRVTFFNHQHVSTKIARNWLRDYKATTIGIDTKKVCHLVKHHMFETKAFENNDKAIRRFINKVGEEHIFDLLDLRLADKKGGKFPKKVYGILKLREKIREEINRKPPFTTKDLALTGHDIIALGFKAGPVIGSIQKFLLPKVLDDPSLNQKETLIQIVKENWNLFTV